jgi:hypothetical protein
VRSEFRVEPYPQLATHNALLRMQYSVVTGLSRGVPRG